MHDFILENIVPITIYLILGCWWLIWGSYRGGNIINADRFLVLIFFGHFLVGLILFIVYLIFTLLKDLTPTRLKTWLLEEWK